MNTEATRALRELKANPDSGPLWARFLARVRPWAEQVVFGRGGAADDVDEVLGDLTIAIRRAWENGAGPDPDRPEWTAYVNKAMRQAYTANRQSSLPLAEGGSAHKQFLHEEPDPHASDPNGPASSARRAIPSKDATKLTHALLRRAEIEERVKNRMQRPEQYDALAEYAAREISLEELQLRLGMKKTTAAKAAHQFRSRFLQALIDLDLHPGDTTT